MFQKAAGNSGDLKSESRLCLAKEDAAVAPSHTYNERVMPASTSKQHQGNRQSHQFSGNPKEEMKSHKLGDGNFNSLSQYSHQQAQANRETHQPSNDDYTNSNNLNQRSNIRVSHSATNPQLYQASQYHQQQHAALSTSQSTALSSSRSAFTSHEALGLTPSSRQQSGKLRAAPLPSTLAYNHSKDEQLNSTIATHNPRVQDQQDRDTDEVVTMIKEELEKNFDGFREHELETLGSLERDLPVELSFLIRQQAFCMARMNYLDRQIRELKESRLAAHPQNLSTSAASNQYHPSPRQLSNIATANSAANVTSSTQIKNGNFIPSDDSGGEYSRATISDDDELSSLLDQIAKSVRPDHRSVNQPNVSMSNNQQQQPQQQRANYSVISNPPQQYAIINPNQLHHQAVPVFVMGSSIAVAAHPSSISSNVLPGVHFQPEPRYNQYYEDFYVRNNSSASTMQRHNGVRSQQFDSSISAIEQLVSQKEKRQIKSQLKSADNWLKMRSSGLCNLNDNFSNLNIRGTSNNGVVSGDMAGGMSERNLPASSSSAALVTENSNSVIEENRSR